MMYDWIGLNNWIGVLQYNRYTTEVEKDKCQNFAHVELMLRNIGFE